MAQKMKSLGSNILIVVLILIILVASTIGIYAWARYQSSINGTATAQVAKWSFKVVDAIPQTTDVIDFAVTRTDNNTSVADGKLAPGTYGQIDIEIDARGTETILEYLINVELENYPKNLLFYKDSAKTERIEIVQDCVQKGGFMSLEDVKEVRTEHIYWEWPYESGATDEEIQSNDVIDTEDEGKLVKMRITVTGWEVLEEKIDAVYLFKDGEQNIALTGGWTGGYVDGTNPGAGNYSIGDNISCNTWGTWCRYDCWTNNTIDLTNYDELCIEFVSITGLIATYSDIRISAGETFIIEKKNYSETNWTTTFDISDVKGLNRIYLSTSNGGNFTISKIYLK